MSTRTLVFALALFFPLGSKAQAPEPAACEAVVVSSPQAGVEGKLRASKILDLTVEVVFAENLRGDHLLELELLTPEKHLYQRIAVPFSDQARERPLRKVEGYPKPLRVEPLQPMETQGSKKRAVRVSVPVAGTSIIKRGVYGEWQVSARVDGASSPCSTKAFNLEP